MQELENLRPHGVFLRRDAIAIGYSDRDLSRAVRSREVVRIRHGAYVDAGRWLAADEVGRHVLACHAVMMTHQTPVALSHVSGSAVHGLRLWGVDLTRVHVTRLGVTAARKHHDVAYHDGSPGDRPVEAEGTRVLTVARSALGAAMVSSVEAGMVTIDSAYDLDKCSLDDLRAAYGEIRHWPGTARLQVTLRLACPGSESVGESRARFLFFMAGLPRPILQYPVYDGDQLVGFTDFAWPDLGLLGEFDGKVKYGALLRPGQDPTDALFREKVREDRIREITGWRMIRLTWADLESRGRTVERLRRLLRKDG